MSGELTVIQPAELVRHTTDIAGLCKDIVVKSAKKIGNRLFVPVEGWMSIATAHGCIVTIISVEKIAGGVLAVAELRRATDGFPMSRAEGFVGEDEETWANRPEYARRAMAQTRAMSRVCRTAFAHVVVMMNAGLETTPMEEVPRDGFGDDDEGTPTNDPVPSTFWDMKKKSGMPAAIDWLARSYDGAKVGVRKTDEGWRVVLFGQAPPAAQGNGHARSEQRPASESRPAAKESVGTPWRDVVCTYGKKNGPLRGKTLGELNDDSLKYLSDIFLAEGKEIKDGDRKMVAALAIWQAEGNRKVAPPTADNGERLVFNGKNHETLYEQIVWGAIKIEDFMDAMKQVKAIPADAKSFMAMSDETAKTFLDDFETAEQHVRNYLAGKEAM